MSKKQNPFEKFASHVVNSQVQAMASNDEIEALRKINPELADIAEQQNKLAKAVIAKIK